MNGKERTARKGQRGMNGEERTARKGQRGMNGEERTAATKSLASNLN